MANVVALRRCRAISPVWTMSALMIVSVTCLAATDCNEYVVFPSTTGLPCSTVRSSVDRKYTRAN
eukprot:10327996-Lingulodinium_polyedra.AAC.1